jgi:hypothetical protein
MVGNRHAVALDMPPSAMMEHPQGRLGFDWAVIVLSCWLVGGVFLDGWAHNHGKVDSSFFTPWHAVFYTGFLAVAAWLGGSFAYNCARGYAYQRALPPGYTLSLVGILIFLTGGLSDVLWHQLFGVEQSIEALYSPTHLSLGVGTALIVSGPFRAAWKRSNRTSAPGWPQLGPMLLSLTLLLSTISFSAQVIHPLVAIRQAATLPSADAMQFYLQILLIAGVIVQILPRMGLTLLALRRWHLPPGSITLIFTLNSLAMCTLDPRNEYRLLAPVMLTGLAADMLIYLLRPSPERHWQFRLFACAVPVCFYLFYFATLWFITGYWWSVHLWTGAIALAGLTGWLLSYLAVLPREPGAKQGA